MKAYDVHFKDGDWSMLVVADTAREAKRIAWPEMRGMDSGHYDEYVDVRVVRVRDPKVEARAVDVTAPFVDDNPPLSCENCESWWGCRCEDESADY